MPSKAKQMGTPNEGENAVGKSSQLSFLKSATMTPARSDETVYNRKTVTLNDSDAMEDTIEGSDD